MFIFFYIQQLTIILIEQDTQRHSMPHDVWTPMLTHNKSLLARNKVAHVELLRELARPVPRYAVTVIYSFEKLLFITKYRMRYVIFMPSNTKEIAINQTMVDYARANNSDLLRSLKHLMKTRLYSN